MKGIVILSAGIVTLFCALSCEGGGRSTPPTPQGKKGVAVTVKKESAPPAVSDSAVVNVYIENSGSMDGYVKGVTEFEQAVYSYLRDIELSDLCSTMNLNYINSKVLRQPGDLQGFIEKLEPSSFRQRGGGTKHH